MDLNSPLIHKNINKYYRIKGKIINQVDYALQYSKYLVEFVHRIGHYNH